MNNLLDISNRDIFEQKKYYKSFHRFYTDFKTDKIPSDISNKVIDMFVNGCKNIYPYKTYFLAIVYAKCLEKYFKIPFYEALDCEDLLYDNGDFKPYSKDTETYNTIMETIKDIWFFQSISEIENIFKEEYGINMNKINLSGFWITPLNKLIYVNHHINHLRYIVTSQYDITHWEMANDELKYHKERDLYIHNLVKSGWVRCCFSQDGIGIDYSSKTTIQQIELLLMGIVNNVNNVNNTNDFKGGKIVLLNIDTNEYHIVDDIFEAYKKLKLLRKNRY